MTDEIVKRLRWSASGKVGAEQARLERNAADRIEALSAEVEMWKEAIDRVNDRAIALVNENDRLREVLERNIDDEPCWRDHHGYCQAHYLEYDCRVAAARAVLGETT